MPRTSVLFSLCLAGAVTPLFGAVPTGWTFQIQARSSLDPGIAPLNLPFPSSLSSQYVSLDNDGSVVTRVILGGSATEGFFYGINGTGGIILSVNSPEPAFSAYHDHRDGLIALEDAGSIVIDTSGNLMIDYPPGGPEGVSNFSGMTMDSSGAICYRGDFGSEDKNIIDEYIDGVRSPTQLANTYDGNYSFLFAPRMNESRQVVGNTIPQTGPTRRILRWEPGGSATTIAETGANWNSFVNSTAIADSGDVAFSARRTADSVWEVNRSDGSVVTMIADGNDPDISNSSIANFPPSVNSDGWVAFRATDVAFNSTALWVGDGENLVKLIEYDQMIDTDLGPLALGFDFGGFTGKQVTNGVVDINDNGQVAFEAFLRNGTIGVFVATPVAADPCPSPPDFVDDDQLDIFDVFAFLDAYAAMDPAADFTGEGTFDIFDVFGFLDVFNAGCV
ncbi:MAG: hypothetical protein KC996_10675 [Phycisphaerales bacterium]|nr:hypothetical protein [Phycisphaerales bacterium]